MAHNYDVIKVGSRYQVVDTATNTPIGKTRETRAEAWNYIDELYAEEMVGEMYPMATPHRREPDPQGTVETAAVAARVSPKQGHDTVGRKPNG